MSKPPNAVKLYLQPITYNEACEFVALHHRHHEPPQFITISIACNDGDKVVGVAMLGNPVARHYNNTWTLELRRLCTAPDAPPNVCSFLYAASWQATKAIGYKRLITYTLKSESGVSLKAAGWKLLGETAGGSWNRKSRPRVDKHPLGQKLLWSAE